MTDFAVHILFYFVHFDLFVFVSHLNEGRVLCYLVYLFAARIYQSVISEQSQSCLTLTSANHIDCLLCTR